MEYLEFTFADSVTDVNEDEVNELAEQYLGDNRAIQSYEWEIGMNTDGTPEVLRIGREWSDAEKDDSITLSRSCFTDIRAFVRKVTGKIE